ncbi:L,D-transpeptidase family protein [Streptomyces sp. NPDC001904]|uniref:L,D-transpeptidase family protein n=1 Tax=Streptomyces sp. NPDC001904 TaxID=3154531 RepID=UPI00332C5FB3
MRPLRAGIAATVVLCAALGSAPSASAAAPLPARMADTGGGSQLITAEAPRASSTSGTVTWWDRRADGRWVRAGSAPARFGANGLVAGSGREQGTNTTPAGLYDLPFAFGTKAAPGGTSIAYRTVRDSSWWCQDNKSRSYNRWTQPRPADCRASESEHLADYGTQYAHALVIGFNYHRPVRGRGAGIFLHVNGRAATAGCVSVPKDAMRRIMTWVRPGRAPHIAIGTAGGSTAITRY